MGGRMAAVGRWGMSVRGSGSRPNEQKGAEAPPPASGSGPVPPSGMSRARAGAAAARTGAAGGWRRRSISTPSAEATPLQTPSVRRATRRADAPARPREPRERGLAGTAPAPGPGTRRRPPVFDAGAVSSFTARRAFPGASPGDSVSRVRRDARVKLDEARRLLADQRTGRIPDGAPLNQAKSASQLADEAARALESSTPEQPRSWLAHGSWADSVTGDHRHSEDLTQAQRLSAPSRLDQARRDARDTPTGAALVEAGDRLGVPVRVAPDHVPVYGEIPRWAGVFAATHHGDRGEVLLRASNATEENLLTHELTHAIDHAAGIGSAKERGVSRDAATRAAQQRFTELGLDAQHVGAMVDATWGREGEIDTAHVITDFLQFRIVRERKRLDSRLSDQQAAAALASSVQRWELRAVAEAANAGDLQQAHERAAKINLQLGEAADVHEVAAVANSVEDLIGRRLRLGLEPLDIAGAQKQLAGDVPPLRASPDAVAGAVGAG